MDLFGHKHESQKETTLSQAEVNHSMSLLVVLEALSGSSSIWYQRGVAIAFIMTWRTTRVSSHHVRILATEDLPIDYSRRILGRTLYIGLIRANPQAQYQVALRQVHQLIY